jgi:hypothetical protein
MDEGVSSFTGAITGGIGGSGEAGSWLRSWSSSGKLGGEVRDDPDRGVPPISGVEK